ncbi:MAG TPA: solute:sodium symporter family transporter [Arachidicoccus sp.]|nr:solute:sodium symporter family transporter [Arachidicoccus sp.]
MNIVTVTSFIVFIAVIILLCWYKTRKHKITSLSNLFLANRSLSFMFIGGGLLFANINTATIIGENELVYTNNMSVMAWGLTSVLAMLIVSEFFMPIYLRTGIATTPDYLEARYDRSTKKIVSLIFLVSYVVNLLPSVLYSGAVAFNGLFHVSTAWNLDYWATLWILIWLMGLAGCLCAVLGGLRAIAVSDTILGAGIFIAGIILPVLGLKFLGHGDLHAGLTIVLNTKKEHLNSIGSATDAVPFPTLFTGMLLVNLYYWGTEQYIVQQVLGSKDLASCQKGIVVACFGKILSILLLNIPGLIAVHLFLSMTNTAEVFPNMASLVSPPFFSGYIAAIIFGASITTFNAGLNSSSTLFVLNVYQPWLAKKGRVVPEKKLLTVAKRFEIMACLGAVIIAPFILFVRHGMYNYIQMVNGFFSLPIFTIIIVGFLTKRVPPIAAKIGLIFFIVTYGVLQVVFPVKIHFLYLLAILFFITAAIMLIIGRCYPMKVPYQQKLNNKVDIQPWKQRHIFAVVLIAIMVGIFALFSPLGLAG